MRDIIQELHDKIADDCTPVDVDLRYTDMLDECYSFKGVGGPFAHMLPSRVLQEMDPTAYRCGFNDWLDDEDFVEIGDEWYRLDDVDKVKDELIDELESDISDHEDDLSTIDEEDEPEEVAITQGCIDELQDLLSQLRKHTF